MQPQFFNVVLNSKLLYYADASGADVGAIRKKFDLSPTYSDTNVIRAAIRDAVWEYAATHAEPSDIAVGAYNFTIVPKPTDKQDRSDLSNFDWFGILFYPADLTAA